MVQLMDLPHEIRLQIYEAVVTDRRGLSIDEYEEPRPRELLDAFSLRLTDKPLSDDIMPLYWSRNTFYYFDWYAYWGEDSYRRSWDRWLSRSVKEAVRHIRRLQFYIYIPPEHQCEGLTSSGKAGSGCLFTATVDLGRRPDSAVQMRDHPCTYVELAYDRLMTVVSRIPCHNRKPQVTSALIMELLECSLIKKFVIPDEEKEQ